MDIWASHHHEHNDFNNFLPFLHSTQTFFHRVDLMKTCHHKSTALVSQILQKMIKWFVRGLLATTLAIAKITATISLWKTSSNESKVNSYLQRTKVYMLTTLQLDMCSSLSNTIWSFSILLFSFVIYQSCVLLGFSPLYHFWFGIPLELY